MLIPPSSAMTGIDVQTRITLAYDTVVTLFLGGLAVLIVGYLIARRRSTI